MIVGDADSPAHRESRAVGYALWPFPVLLVVFFISIVLSAMFAGLTIGLFGMDSITLDVISSAGKEPDRAYARQIIPIRRYGHQLLATLLIGNMLTMVIISQMVAAMIQSTEFVNFIVATVVVFVFAEIIPMCVCNKGSYALVIGAKSAPIVSVALFLLYPVAKPLGMLLGCIVAHADGLVYDRNELKKLVRVHCEKYADKCGLGDDEMRMIIGALEMNEANLSVLLRPLEKTFMLSCSLSITRRLVEQLWVHGMSRLPVYANNNRSHIAGVLYVRDLLNVTLQQMDGSLTVEDVVSANPRGIVVVPESIPLQELLKVFLSTASHLIFVKRDDSDNAEELAKRQMTSTTTSWSTLISPKVALEGVTDHPIVGIVTLEDVIEHIIKADIYDEYDRGRAKDDDDDEEEEECYNNGNSRGGIMREKWTESDESKHPLLGPKPHVMPRVNFFSYTVDDIPAGVHKHNDALTEDQKWVLANFLINSFAVLAPWSLPQMKYFIDCIGDHVVRLTREEEEGGRGPVLYRSGHRSEAFTLLLSGGAQLVLGDGAFSTEKRSFFSFGEQALLHEEGFVPDYTAVISRTSRYLRFTMRDLVEVQRRLERWCDDHATTTTLIDFQCTAREGRSCMDEEEILIP